MKSRRVRLRIHGTHQHSLSSMLDPVIELESAWEATCQARLCLPHVVSTWRRRPLHLYGSRTTLVGWTDTPDLGYSPQTARADELSLLATNHQ